MNKSEVWSQLQETPKRMAALVSEWLPDVDLNRYQKFLDLMFHYTLQSGERLENVAKNATDPYVQKVFSRLATEEANHYQLAKLDLAAFQAVPSSTTPETVEAFQKFWKDLPVQSAGAQLGAMYVLENVGKHLQVSAMSALARLKLEMNQARFVLVHLEADVGHGNEIGELCKRYLDDPNLDPELILMGAEKGSEFWIELHRQAFCSE